MTCREREGGRKNAKIFGGMSQKKKNLGSKMNKNSMYIFAGSSVEAFTMIPWCIPHPNADFLEDNKSY